MRYARTQVADLDSPMKQFTMTSPPFVTAEWMKSVVHMKYLGDIYQKKSIPLNKLYKKISELTEAVHSRNGYWLSYS